MPEPGAEQIFTLPDLYESNNPGIPISDELSKVIGSINFEDKKFYGWYKKKYLRY